MIVVFDTNVVVQAIFWPRSNARKALTGLARRRFQVAINASILDEYALTLAKVQTSIGEVRGSPAALAWIAAKSMYVEPMPLTGKLSRDADDNLFVATAAAAGARFLFHKTVIYWHWKSPLV